MADNAAVNPTLASPAVATKPGWQTTEFWVTILIVVSTTLSSIAGYLPEKWAIAASSIAGAAYSISRAITKANDPTPPAPSDPNAPLKPPV